MHTWTQIGKLVSPARSFEDEPAALCLGWYISALCLHRDSTALLLHNLRTFEVWVGGWGEGMRVCVYACVRGERREEKEGGVESARSCVHPSVRVRVFMCFGQWLGN